VAQTPAKALPSPVVQGPVVLDRIEPAGRAVALNDEWDTDAIHDQDAEPLSGKSDGGRHAACARADHQDRPLDEALAVLLLQPAWKTVREHHRANHLIAYGDGA